MSEQLVSQFLASDVIVVGAPLYNFTIPTQLKAWIDRLRVIYANGTESNLLRRSLQRALYKDETGHRLTDTDMGHCLAMRQSRTTSNLERSTFCAASLRTHL